MFVTTLVLAEEMRAVVQEDRTGCGVACVAAITNQKYTDVKRAAAYLGVSVENPKLWSDTQAVRKLLASFGISVGQKEEPFCAWDLLPTRALLAIKWHREKAGPAWHWVVFERSKSGSVVLDPKRGLRTNRRTDFGRIKPKWFIRIEEMKA